MKTTLRSFASGLSLLLALAAAPWCAAQTVWNTTTGDWNTTGNWSPATIPVSSTSVQIDNGGTASLTAAGTAAGLYLGTDPDDSGTLLVSGPGHLTTGGDIFLGSQGTGTITLSAGGQITNTGAGSYLGYDQLGTGGARTGTVTITGSGSTWNTGYMEVGGWNATGSLTVENGGHVGVAGSSFDVGTEGVGTASVLTGGTISASYLILGQGTSGALTINGAGSAVTVSSTNVNDTGTLTLSAGGVLTTGNFHGNGNTTVTGAGSAIVAPTGLSIGINQTGHLMIADGASVTSANQNSIGSFASGVGTVLVTGTGSSLSMTGSVFLGGNNAGAGILTITEGGAVTSAEGINLATGSATLNIGAAANATAVAPGTLVAPQLFGYSTGTAVVNFNHTGAAYTFATTIQGPATVQHNGPGTTLLTATNTYFGATTISSGTLRVDGSAASSAFTVTGGALSGAGTVGALTVSAGGTLAPGNSPGTLSAGNTTFEGGGSFEFELNNATGAAGTNWDLLAITGSLNLTATSGNPFSIDVTSLTLANAAGLAANFDSASDYSFTFVTTTTGITGFAADKFSIDTTGFTNPFSGTWAVGTANGGNDLALTYTGVSAIPEPSTYAAIFGAGALAVALWRRRRRA